MRFSERIIVEGILSKDRKAFGIMYETYFKKIYNYSLLQLGEQEKAEEVTEKIFVEVINTLDQCFGTSTLSKWIFKATRRHIRQARVQEEMASGTFPGKRSRSRGEFFRLEEALLRHCHSEAVCGG